MKKLSHIDSAALSLLNEDSLPQCRFHTPISRVLSSLLNRAGVVEALAAIVWGRQGPVATPGEIPSSFSSLGGVGLPALSSEPALLPRPG